MDPVTVLGVATAVIAFVDLGTKVTKRLAELSKAGDIPEAFRSIETRLPFIISLIDRTQHGADHLSPEAEEAFKKVIRQCFDQVNQLGEILQKVRISKSDSRLRRLVRASVSVVEEGRVRSIAAALRDNIQLLTFFNITPAEKERPQAKRTPSEPLPSYASATGVFLVPFSRDEQFIGRDSNLSSIASAFGKHKRVAISGIGGVG